jgi:glycosyltransferase involved in cell wall biosynthesis
VNVLAFSRIFPSLQHPARGIYNLHRFKALSKFCNVRVIAPISVWDRIGSPTRGVTWYDELPVEYLRYWFIPKLAPQWHAAALHRSVRSHISALQQTSPCDVILAAFAYPDVVAGARLAADLNRPFVALVMGSDVNDLAQRPQLRPQVREALNGAERIIAVSSALKRRVVELGIPADRVLVHHNGVDGARFAIRDKMAARGQVGLPEDKQVVSFIGNVVAEKGPDIFVESIGRLDRSLLPGLVVVVVGGGPLAGPLRSRAEALGLGGIVRFVGRRHPDEIPLWMAASDLLCLASRREGCPNVVLEALASGRPVVAARVGAVPDLIGDGNGIIVPPDDPDALASAIQRALDRSWEPSVLRSSVPSLTWDDLGKAFFDVLGSASSSRLRQRTAKSL